MREAEILFEPMGIRVRTREGSTLLDAARSRGICIRSECGGRGICGKCRVFVRGAVSEPTERELEVLPREELERGARLACQARVAGSCVVYVPPESRLLRRRILSEGVRAEVVVSPAVEKLYLELEAPSISDPTPDFERLARALVEEYGVADLEAPLEVLSQLPGVLRRAGWKITVVIRRGRELISVEEGDTRSSLYGLALDIGTSKIACYLVDLSSGDLVGVESAENPQIQYGEDLISRLTYVVQKDGGLEELREAVTRAANRLIRTCCSKAGVAPSAIYEVVVVGNTVMHHIFMGLDPRYLGTSPYVPAAKKVESKAKNLGLAANEQARVLALPIIARFVGADAVADILATRLYEASEYCLLLDIGTNTEVVLGRRDKMLATSCASGPAFEGGHVEFGTKAVEGAIERVRIDPDTLEVEYETIGDARPIGICGSGVVDAIAELLKCGVVDRRGVMKEVECPRIRKRREQLEFVVAWREETGIGRDIVITQRDVREIQLAKGAVYAGCSVLMKRLRIDSRDVKKIYIAGAFGTRLNVESAIVIGLIPDVSRDLIEVVGNAAGVGAVMALVSTEERARAEEISRKVEYVELVADPSFKDELRDSLYFPHRYLDRFPSVKRVLGEV